MPDNFKLIQKDNPKICHQTSQDAFKLGRSRDCEIVIEDPHISRVQATVQTSENNFLIKNVGRNPLLVNGSVAAERHLKDGDVLTLGKVEFIFESGRIEKPVQPLAPAEERTVVVEAPQEEAADCRLMITAADGAARAVPVDRDKLVIGRSSEADIRLKDPLISRRHCVIERREEGTFARNVSATNPLEINGEPRTETRLYSGDRLRMGSHSIVFISNLPEDIGQSENKAAQPAPGYARLVLGLAFALSLGLGAWFGYIHGYRPWQVQKRLLEAERQMDTGKLPAAEKALKALLARDLPAEQVPRARQLLADAVLGLAEEKTAAGDLVGAKNVLGTHLSAYGSGPEAEKLWDRMDYYRISLGRKLEEQGKSQQALHQYAAVRDSSLYQVEAQKGISRIWLKSQHEQRQEQTIVQLLKEAETHFAQKRYLTPVNRNAYAVYRAVLVLDPDHMMALKRIEDIKAYYRRMGEDYFKGKKWRAALRSFERLRIIDPENKEVSAKINQCRRRLAAGSPAAAAASGKPGSKKGNADRQRQEIKQLLESSGTESTWIMKYLFEEQQGETDTETPW